MDIRIGISACLVGQPVRFDGSGKADRSLQSTLGRHVTWVPVCPEVGAGMGAPRETVRLIGRADAPRLVGSRTGRDWTEEVARFSAAELDRLDALDLCGYVFESRSPTCGMERVRVYDHNGAPHKDGVGVFARALMDRFPLLPVEERGRLLDPQLRDDFLQAVFAYARWKQTLHEGVTRGRLVAFHSDEKYLLMAHSPERLRDLGRLVADARAERRALRYGGTFMRAMRCHATLGRHVNVLHHMAGYLRDRASAGARAQVAEAIDDYQHGLVPRSVPVTLLRHHAREHQLAYLARQTYLTPYPKQLARAR